MVLGKLDYGRQSKRWKVPIILMMSAMGLLTTTLYFWTISNRREPVSISAHCASNLRQIGIALSVYAAANGGCYPPSLNALSQQIVASGLRCPATGDSPAPSYSYYGKGLCGQLTGSTIIAEDNQPRHSGGVLALLGDGRVEWRSAASTPSP